MHREILIVILTCVFLFATASTPTFSSESKKEDLCQFALANLDKYRDLAKRHFVESNCGSLLLLRRKDGHETGSEKRVYRLQDPLRANNAQLQIGFPLIKNGDSANGRFVGLFNDMSDLLMSGHAWLNASVDVDFDNNPNMEARFHVNIPEFHMTGIGHNQTLDNFNFQEYLEYVFKVIECQISGCDEDEWPIRPDSDQLTSSGAYSFHAVNVTITGLAYFEWTWYPGHVAPIILVRYQNGRMYFGSVSIWAEELRHNGTLVENPNWEALSTAFPVLCDDYMKEVYGDDFNINYVIGEALRTHIAREMDIVDAIWRIVHEVLTFP